VPGPQTFQTVCLEGTSKTCQPIDAGP
jgi:hypothetical protein